MNKTKRVAWHKHLKRQRREKDKLRAAARGQTPDRPAAGRAAAGSAGASARSTTSTRSTAARSSASASRPTTPRP